MSRPFFIFLSLVIMNLISPLKGEEKDQNNFTLVGELIRHTQNNNLLDFFCTNGHVKFELCASDIFRIRMSPSGNFKPDEPFVVIQYDWPVVKFKLKEKKDRYEISTERMLIKAFKSPFRFEFYDLNGNPVNKDWQDGSMGYRGKEVLCKKELTSSDHFFGLGQRYEESDLRGRTAVCEATREYTPVPFFIGTDGYGIFFHNTWASEFDFTGNPYTFSAPGGDELDYYFIYGPDMKHILHQYSLITGFSPLPPKWAFGLFSSRWNEEFGKMKDGQWVIQMSYAQHGQEGLLKMIELAREIFDWPLDGIRVHSTGPDQNFYVSPETNWPEFSWGSFPAVDKMVEELHKQNIHPLFWETPGVFGNTKMYEEGIKNNYFLTMNGKPYDLVFGFRSPPGALVDFMNPEARKWWGKYHYFMADFGSDGVAGDWDDHRKLKNLYSPSTGMYAPEFGNIFSLLFNQASWEAYRESRPDKRCINFGLVYWAGGQRYPMQGTQDSHHMGKNIHGEMMGCINLGLSGIPFRTFTDNVSRYLETEAPLSRLSQYMALTVAGERTQIMVTGNVMADQNYRKYARLRYQLMPYIYTYAREATRSGVPMVRAMVLENQYDPEAYTAYGQYLLGEHLLIAPLWSDTTFYRDIYLPEGEWIDFYSDNTYAGKQTISYHAPIDIAPILVKKGAIIPMAPQGQSYVDELISPLTVHIYPDKTGTFELYEDDGVSYDYENDVFCMTEYAYVKEKTQMIIRKSVPKGNYTPLEKEHLFCIHKMDRIDDVVKSGSSLPITNTWEAFNNSSEAWFLDPANNNQLWIKVNDKVPDEISIVVKYH